MPDFLPGLIVLLIMAWVVFTLFRGIYRRVFLGRVLKNAVKRQDSPAVAAMLAALEQNQQSEFAELANKASNVEITELVATGEVADHEGRVAAFPGYAKNHPNSARAHYLHGRYLVAKAWDARGSGTADTVSEHAASKFMDHINSAEVALERAIELDPDHPDAYGEMMVVYRANGNLRQALTLQDDAQARFPNHIGIHVRRQAMLAERWHGSDELVLNFARLNSNRDSTDHLACLVPAAHLDNWMGSDESISDYLEDKNKRREINDAFERYIKVSADPEQAQGYLDGLQYFACALSMIGDNKRAKRAFKKMKGRYSSAAWNMWNDAEEIYARAKLSCGA